MSEIRDAMTALLGGRALRTADGGQDDGALRAAFAEFDTQGWTRVGLHEELGGDGGTLADARSQRLGGMARTRLITAACSGARRAA